MRQVEEEEEEEEGREEAIGHSVGHRPKRQHSLPEQGTLGALRRRVQQDSEAVAGIRQRRSRLSHARNRLGATCDAERCRK